MAPSPAEKFFWLCYAKDSVGNQFSITHSNGAHWGDNTWSGWSLVGAESVDGVNTSAWEHNGGKLWFGEHNSNWAYRAGGYAQTGTAAYFQAETNFGQDFNSDGITGSPLTASESAGLIDLFKDSSGYGAKDSVGNQFSITHSNGAHWGDNTWSGWSLVGAESVDGVNTSAWEHSSGKLWFGDTTATGLTHVLVVTPRQVQLLTSKRKPTLARISIAMASPVLR